MKKLIAVLLLVLLAAGCVLMFFPDRLPPQLAPASRALRELKESVERKWFPQPEPSPDAPTYAVICAIDGDTLLLSLDGTETTVRLIGVDAPESVHRIAEKNTPEGKTASQWMKQLVEGKRVSLEYDQERTDQYGRTLAYVYVDGVMLEDALLAAGMARTLTMEPNTRYQHHFETLEKEARESGAGFWGSGFFERQGTEN